MLLLSPLPLSTRFPVIQFPSPTVFLHHQNPHITTTHLPFPFISATATTSSSVVTCYTSSDALELDVFENDPVSLQSRHYDFTPLLDFLSRSSLYPKSDSDSEVEFNSTLNSGSDSDTASPTSLDPTEFQLAEAYRAVPAPLWHSLLKSLCSSSSSIGLGYAVVSWLQKHNLCFSYELLYSILIHALGRSEKLYEAFILSQKQTLTPLTYNALIGACARNNDLEKALNLMSRMRQDGYQSDFVNYSLIIQSLTRTNKIDVPILQKLYEEIESDKIELDGQLLNDIILGFAKAGDPNRALYFLSMVQASGLNPKTSTFVAIISALGNHGRTEEAEAIFEEMKEGGLKPRIKAFNALLKGYARKGSLKEAESIVSEMEKSGLSPDEHTYGLLVDAYANVGRWESARHLLKQMEARNVQPNSFIFSRILASYRDRGEWQKTFEVLREMKNSNVKPDRHFYNVMIDTFGKFNCLDHAMETYDRMLSEGIEPDVVTWNTLIDCHCKHGYHDRAAELFEEMQERGYLPCPTTYNIMINSLGEQEKWDEVKILLGKMQSQGLLPNVITYTTLVDIYGQSGRFNDAIECLEAMKSAGLKPSSTMYNALINAFAQRVCHPSRISSRKLFETSSPSDLEPMVLNDIFI
ncbi:pentatricopeptide repeat-containing protein At5g42310, chloroplastic isoform X2 [Benincasa hispida]|uniref:pentatricopeptide repeat-containing protein At5g42310, chloroplastic isoform X2 n=1 Tax=Benincasa hispida TaxID=102211 RepID=UPI00190089DA|nr:pentatricopeptide repeat-containing protein At5g42310, chloroplastic isoform X2 [Benincasa hispida]